MSHRCLEIAEIESVRLLSPDDARRRDAEACPRCRRLLLSYLEFLEDRSVPTGVDPERARVQLQQAFERALLKPAEAEPRTAVPAEAEIPRDRPALGSDRATNSRWSRWFGPRLAWGTVAAMVVLAGLYASVRWRATNTGEDVLRAAPDRTEARAHDRPILFAPRAVPAGLELRWTSTTGADAYRVLLLDENLAQIATLGPAADTIAVLAPGRLPSGLRSGQTVAWQVEALEGGYVIGSSETSLVKLP